MHPGPALVTEQVSLFMLVVSKAAQLLLYDKVSISTCDFTMQQTRDDESLKLLDLRSFWVCDQQKFRL